MDPKSATSRTKPDIIRVYKAKNNKKRAWLFGHSPKPSANRLRNVKSLRCQLCGYKLVTTLKNSLFSPLPAKYKSTFTLSKGVTQVGRPIAESLVALLINFHNCKQIASDEILFGNASFLLMIIFRCHSRNQPKGGQNFH